MKHHLKCSCGATAIHTVILDFDAGGAEIDTDREIAWEGGKPDCDHDLSKIEIGEMLEPEPTTE